MTNAKNKEPLPLWRLGFRPFFLIGSVIGAVSLALWLLSFSGYYQESSINSLWHAHEMLHGFVIAIIVGFLLTASANWSGKKGLNGIRQYWEQKNQISLDGFETLILDHSDTDRNLDNL